MKFRLVAVFAVATAALLAAGCTSSPATSPSRGAAAVIPLLTGGALSFTALSSKYTMPALFVYQAFYSWALQVKPAAQS